jgi:hypothetical protein
VLIYTLVKKDRPPPCTTLNGRAEVLAVCCRDWRRASFTMVFLARRQLFVFVLCALAGHDF